VEPESATVCIGQAASAAAVLLAAGTKDKRMALPNARILLHQPATEGGYGQSSDLEIQAREILRMRTAMERIIATHSGRSEEQVRRDVERDKYFSAEEAKEDGIVDEVLTSLKRRAEVGASGEKAEKSGARGGPPRRRHLTWRPGGVSGTFGNGQG